MRGSRTRAERDRAVPDARTARVAQVAAFVILGVTLLSGCTPGGTAPSAAPSTQAATSAATPSAGSDSTSPAAPALHPDGSAQDNLPLFTSVVAQVWASDARASASAYIDGLSAAGFTRADMQATADTTTVDNPAESIQFSVRWGAAECLVGQVGPSTGDPVTAVLPQLAGGRCLIGKTPPVNG